MVDVYLTRGHTPRGGVTKTLGVLRVSTGTDRLAMATLLVQRLILPPEGHSLSPVTSDPVGAASVWLRVAPGYLAGKRHLNK